MQRRTGWSRRLALRAVLALGVVGCAESFPQTTLLPRGDFARMVDTLFRTTFWWAVAVFVLVEGALLIAIFRFRARPGAPAPKQFHGGTLLEVIWTVIPAFILSMIAVPTVQTIFRTSVSPAAPAVEVEVIGHQWWWEYRYPKLGVVTANELHVPVAQTVALKMWSADVIHSFWFPQVAAKRDVFPSSTNPKAKKYTPLWFTADSTGVYSGQCAEFCGIQHGRMGLRVIVDTPEQFAAWVSRQRVGSPLVNGGKLEPAADSALKADTVIAKGATAFVGAGCIACHAMVGTPLAGQLGMKGPNLSHVGSRLTIAAGMLENTPSNLARWLRDPQSVKQGSLMVLPRSLTEPEIATLVAYLRAHQ